MFLLILHTHRAKSHSYFKGGSFVFYNPANPALTTMPTINNVSLLIYIIMRKQNFKSDFDFVLALKDGEGNDIGFPDFNWELVLLTTSRQARIHRLAPVRRERELPQRGGQDSRLCGSP